jgi:hypothetical protein
MKYFRFLKITSFFLLTLGLLSANSTFANEKECLNEIKLLIKHKEKAQFDGGFWSLFEKSRELSAKSVIGLHLDKEVNQLIGHLTHLCKTLDGIPLNDLAMIIRDDLKLMNEEEYRKQLVILGKPDKEIDIWFKFYSFSLKHQHRALNYPSIKETLSLSKGLVSSYVKLYLENQSKSNSEAFKIQVDSLLDQISSFTKSDKNIVQAENELAQVPYWDIQESVGGS